MYTQEDINTLKEITDYKKFYEQFPEINLNKSNSKNIYSILCPFHNENTPSFSIDINSGYWRCYADCGIKNYGDCIDFLCRYYNIGLKRAIEILAEFNNYTLETSEDFKKELENFKKVTEFNKFILNHFKENLKNDLEGIKYLKSRNINDKSINKFNIGLYDPILIKNIINKENLKVALDVGIIKYNENNKIIPYSRIKRIIIPYIENNNILTFTGRSVNGENPKYQNFKNSSIVQKNELIFNFDYAVKSNSLMKYKYCFITEGQFDVIKAYQNGVKNIIGLSCKKPSESQLYKLKKYCKYFVLIIEDQESQKSLKETYKQIKKIFPFSSIKILKIYKDEKFDLSDYFDKFTLKDFIKDANNAKPYNEFVILDILSNIKIKTIEDKLKCLDLLKPHLLSIKRISEKSLYISNISYILGIPEIDIMKELNNKQRQENIKENIRINKNYDNLNIARFKSLLSLFFYNNFDNNIIIDLFEKYNISKFMTKDYIKIYENIKFLISIGKKEKEIISLITSNQEVNQEIFVDILLKSGNFAYEENELEEFFIDIKTLLKNSIKTF